MPSILCTIQRKIPSVFIVFAALCVLASSAWAQLVEIKPDQSKIRLDSELQYWAGLRPIPGPAIQAYRKGKFSAQQATVTHGFGHAEEMWFAVEIKNDSFDDGRTGDPFVIVYDAPLTVGFRLFLVRDDGLTENLVNYASYRAFDPAQFAVNRLRSPEVILAPGEQVTLLAHLQLGIIPASDLHIMRPGTLTSDSLSWASSMTAFYAFALSCLILGIGFQIAMRSLIGCLYIVVLFLLLILVANSDLLIARFIFPDNPTLHIAAMYANLFALAAAICALVSERLRAPDGQRSKVSKFLLVLSGLALLGFLTTFIVETPLSIYASFTMCGIALLANIYVPDAAWQREDNPNLGIKWLSAGIFLTCVAMMGWSLFGGKTELIAFRPGIKITYGILLVMIMTFLTGNLIVLRRRHMTAVDARVEALEREAERSQQLLETERAYIRARETAAARQRQLATASHDIKQPLMSLRSTFDAIASDMDHGVQTRLHEAFKYLETLSKSYTDGTVPQEDTAATERTDKSETEIETYPISVPMSTVQQMFNGEAVSKGIQLRLVNSSLNTTAPPLVLMRILTNLVSNAIKYTDVGVVLIGLRRDGPTIWICDTGRGMTAEEINEFQGAYKKGEASTGHGLGLSVCFELASANNLPLTISSTPGQGTIFQLSLAHHVSDT